MKIHWRKVAIATVDTLLAVYLIMAFAKLNAMGTSHAICDKVDINIADGNTNGFINAKEIKRRLVEENLYPMNHRIDSIDTRNIEEKLGDTPFVRTADCYKTQDGHVYINITQRMPIVRIKADNGTDYYVDDNNRIMPRSNYTSDLIIATGSIDTWYATNYIAPLSKAIAANEMWRNLVEQIHIMPDHGVEIVPRIGDHIVYLGRLPDAKNRSKHQEAINQFVEKKFTRLEKFYRYGLSEAGWNKYSYINIEFDNQIICRRRQHNTPHPIADNTTTATNEAPTATTTDNNTAADKPQTTKKETPQ